MVYERMGEIGGRRRKSAAAVIVGGLACCGKSLGMGEGGRGRHKKREQFYCAECASSGEMEAGGKKIITCYREPG